MDLDRNDDIIIDEKYPETPGLYELIFKKFLNVIVCTSTDK